jgi:hypothetical protein
MNLVLNQNNNDLNNFDKNKSFKHYIIKNSKLIKNSSFNKKRDYFKDIFDDKTNKNNIYIKIMTLKQELFYLENIFYKNYSLNYDFTNSDCKIMKIMKIIKKKKETLHKIKNKYLKINIKIKIIDLIDK